MEIRWDETKRASNRQKHGVDFADAVGVLHDDRALTVEDEHAQLEQRLISLGVDFLGRILAVVYAEDRDGDIRIISARRASAGERKQYEAGL